MLFQTLKSNYLTVMKTLFVILALCTIGVSGTLAQTSSYSFKLVTSSQNALRTTAPILDETPDFMQISGFGIEVGKALSTTKSIKLGVGYGYRLFFSNSMYNKYLLFGEANQRADHLGSFAYHTIEVPLTFSNSLGKFKNWTTSWNVTALGSANLSATYFGYSPDRIGKYSSGFTPFSFSLLSELSFEQEIFNQLTFGIHPNIRLANFTKGDPILYSFSQPALHFANSLGVRLSAHYTFIDSSRFAQKRPNHF